jgi:hypothetical protein
MASNLKTLLSLAALLLCSSTAHSAEIPLTDLSHLDLRNTQAEITTYRGQPSLRLTETKPGSEQALAILRDKSFHDGTIELDVAGAPLKDVGEGARGFIGIAFRMLPDASHYECIYIRPTNGRAEDQLRRNHSTQYMSFPDWPWERLRSESPGVYESYADMVPGEWTHLRIVVHGKETALYIGKTEQPSLLIHDLKLGDSKGAIALWIGPGTDGYFRNLTMVDESTK